MQINENFREEMLRGHFQGFLKMFDKINESTFYEFQLIELIILIKRKNIFFVYFKEVNFETIFLFLIHFWNELRIIINFFK